MSDLITIDGSQGEGGGQILRSSLALSMLTGKAFRIEKIRANRPKPGLMRQHLAAVNAAVAISGAAAEGAALGSRALSFEPGNIVIIEIESEHVTEVFTGFGERGVRAEAVAENALQQTKEYLASGVPVGKHLADQLILPFAMAGTGSFVTQRPTPHTLTNIDVVRKFLDVQVNAEQSDADHWTVSVNTGGACNPPV